MSLSFKEFTMLIVLLLFSNSAFAVQPYPVFVWSESESSFETRCEGLNKDFKSNIVCKIDHKSFDRHFASEKKKAKVVDRDGSDPIFYCGAAGIGFFGDELLGGQLSRDKDFSTEFVSKVKTLACEFAEGEVPKLTLKNGVLTMHLTGNGSVSAGPGWMWPEMRKLFPTADAIWKEKH